MPRHSRLELVAAMATAAFARARSSRTARAKTADLHGYANSPTPQSRLDHSGRRERGGAKAVPDEFKKAVSSRPLSEVPSALAAP